MTDKLAALLARLRARQRDLILEAAKTDALPAHSTVKRIAELENAAVADEEVGQVRRG